MVFRRLAQTVGGLCAVAMALSAQGAQAAQVNWTIDGVFSDGGTFDGTFTFDVASQIVTAWNITTTTPTTDPLYTTGVGQAFYDGLSESVSFQTPINSFETDDLMFDFFFPGAPGTRQLGGSGSEGSTVDLGSIQRLTIIHLVDHGTAVGVAVPEPASWALMILGIGFVGGAFRFAGQAPVSGRNRQSYVG